MLDLVQSGGWLMFPIILCSLIAAGIIGERFWTLRPAEIVPLQLVSEIWGLIQKNKLSRDKIKEIKASSPLGEILAAGLINRKHGREVVKQSIDDKAGQVIHELERFLNILGSIAAITPLLGLLGTVIGMIKVFAAIMAHGTGDASLLAGGISEALVTTAAGLTVAIPALFFYRLLSRRVDELSITMERESVKLVDAMFGGREVDFSEEDE